MLEFIVLRLQGVKRLVFNLPAAASPFHYECSAFKVN
jgi:hypothetical protein